MKKRYPDSPNDLIRKNADRQRLRGLLLEGAASPPTAPVDTAYFNKLRERILLHGKRITSRNT